jgi:hypothetical protein
VISNILVIGALSPLEVLRFSGIVTGQFSLRLQRFAQIDQVRPDRHQKRGFSTGRVLVEIAPVGGNLLVCQQKPAHLGVLRQERLAAGPDHGQRGLRPVPAHDQDGLKASPPDRLVDVEQKLVERFIPDPIHVSRTW